MKTPKAGYGFIPIFTPEDKRRFRPQLNIDDYWSAPNGRWERISFVSDKFCSEDIYRRPIDVGEGFELVPKSETETASMDYTRDGFNWIKNTVFLHNLISYFLTNGSNVIAFRRRKAVVANGGWVSVKDSKRPKIGQTIYEYSVDEEFVTVFDSVGFHMGTTHWQPVIFPKPPTPQKTEAEIAWEKHLADHPNWEMTNSDHVAFLYGFNARGSK